MALQETFEKEGNFLFRYRSFLPLIILAAGIAVFIADYYKGVRISHSAYGIIQYISLAVSILGLIVRIVAVGHTPANTSGRNTKSQLADEVNTTGIYSVVRHPLYLGNFFMWAGAVLLIANFWFVIVFSLAYWIYYERIMFAEEQFLRAKFGKLYLDWANMTPAFYPCCKHFVPSKYPFSIKKVLKKEKNGVLAVFALLFLFHNLRLSLLMQGWIIDMNWIFWGTLISGVVYLILKVLKKFTTVLDEKGR